MRARRTAEAVGTFALVFAGAGSITVDALYGAVVAVPVCRSIADPACCAPLPEGDCS